jgi:excisionase family DNA binding protein
VEKPTENDTQSFISRRDASRLLGVTERTITRWVNSSILQAWKTAGGHSRISASSVNEFLKKRRAELKWRPQADKSLLVVEDDSILLDLYVTAIESWGFPIRIVTAEDGFDGLIHIGQERPDIIITDLKMPGMDGFQMVHSIKDRPELNRVHIIAITALEPDEIAARGGLPEGVPVFQKPAAMTLLKELVEQMIIETTSTDFDYIVPGEGP